MVFENLYSRGVRKKKKKKDILLVVGNFSERHEDAFIKIQGAIFINNLNLFKPGQIRDGYFPDFIHADPKLIVPIIYI